MGMTGVLLNKQKKTPNPLPPPPPPPTHPLTLPPPTHPFALNETFIFIPFHEI